MTLLLNPILKGLEAARRAAAGATHPGDDITVEDRGVSWVFAFVPTGESLGGGASVWMAKDDLRIVKVERGQ